MEIFGNQYLFETLRVQSLYSTLEKQPNYTCRYLLTKTEAFYVFLCLLCSDHFPWSTMISFVIFSVSVCLEIILSKRWDKHLESALENALTFLSGKQPEWHGSIIAFTKFHWGEMAASNRKGIRLRIVVAKSKKVSK